jgi:hypothetical protein
MSKIPTKHTTHVRATEGKKDRRKGGRKPSLSRWRDKFLELIRTTPNISKAARACGIDRHTAYYYKRRNAKFSDEWDEAIEEAVDNLEEHAWAMARGVMRRNQNGELEVIQPPSERLTIFLLGAHRPDKYAKMRHEHTGKDGAAIEVEAKLELKAEVRSTLQRLPVDVLSGLRDALTIEAEPEEPN